MFTQVSTRRIERCLHRSPLWAYFTKLGLTNPGYTPKPGYINPVLYSLVYSVPLKPSDAQNGQIWRARIMKPRLQARARIPCKTHDIERRFLERYQSRRGQQSTRKKVPAESRVFQLSFHCGLAESTTAVHKLLQGSHGHRNNLKRRIRAQLILLPNADRLNALSKIYRS